jgi:hypothetical protein
MKKFAAVIVCLLLVASMLFGCTGIDPVPPQSTQFALSTRQYADLIVLLRSRTKAVKENDEALFMSTVLPSALDPLLYKEEGALIRSAKNSEIREYELKAVDAVTVADGVFTATIDQRYMVSGFMHHAVFKTEFRYVDNRLYYCGPAFETLSRNGVVVSFETGNRDIAQSLVEVETEVLESMKKKFGFTTADPVSINLYRDQQTFLQTVKFDLPFWVGGWHEYKESIKCCTDLYGTNPDEYRSMLAHETGHRMVSELSNDNAAYWLQEGLAGICQDILENRIAYLSDKEILTTYTPIDEHKGIDLEAYGLEDYDKISAYYASSKAYTAYLLETFGWEKVREALMYLRKYPYVPVTGAEKNGSANAYTDEAFKAVLGIDDSEDFMDGFNAWQTQKRDSIKRKKSAA